jgi:GNAT superfamily N-acetyltransferase
MRKRVASRSCAGQRCTFSYDEDLCPDHPPGSRTGPPIGHARQTPRHCDLQQRVSRVLKLTVHEVDASCWPDFERLFESRGGPKACWCMVWRARGAEAKNTKGSARKAAIKARVDDEVPIGLLGYIDDNPIAWCSIAPRSTYRPLGGEDESSGRAGEVWSLVCFFIRREFRGQGVTEQLIEAAADYAKRNGATVLEAYPVDPGSPSYRFMGYVPTFEAAGFEEIGRAGTRRHVMRRTLRK